MHTAFGLHGSNVINAATANKWATEVGTMLQFGQIHASAFSIVGPKGHARQSHAKSHTNSNNAFWPTYGCISQSTAHVFTSINEHQLWQGRGSCILSPLKVLQVFGPSWSGGASVQSATMEGPIIAEFSSLNALNYKAGPRGSKL